jgi:hypothetical protein
MATYTITVHTGPDGLRRPDLVSHVHLTLFGSRATSHEVDLGTLPGVTSGATTTYQVSLTDLGDIQRARVRHDDTGVGPGYFLDHVVVRAGGTLQEWRFPCARWLARHADDGATERTLDALPA